MLKVWWNLPRRAKSEKSNKIKKIRDFKIKLRKISNSLKYWYFKVHLVLADALKSFSLQIHLELIQAEFWRQELGFQLLHPRLVPEQCSWISTLLHPLDKQMCLPNFDMQIRPEHFLAGFRCRELRFRRLCLSLVQEQCSWRSFLLRPLWWACFEALTSCCFWSLKPGAELFCTFSLGVGLAPGMVFLHGCLRNLGKSGSG